MLRFSRLFFVITFITIAGSIYGQNYQSGIGAKVGTRQLVATYQKYINQENAVDLFAGLGYDSGGSGLLVGTAYKWVKPVGENSPEWEYYYGPAASVEFYDGYTDLSLGAVLGGEYTLERDEYSFFAEVMPLYNLGHNDGLIPNFNVGFRSLLQR